MENIKNATLTSVWGDGVHIWDFIEVTTTCKVNMDTLEVFDIEPSDWDDDKYDDFKCQCVTIDGEDYDVIHVSELENFCEEDDKFFWHR